LPEESINSSYWLSSEKFNPKVFGKTKCDREAHPQWVDCPYESCTLYNETDRCPYGYVFDLSRIYYSAVYRYLIHVFFD